MKDLLFVDTSAWFALVNRSDSGHTAVREFLESYRGRRVTSNAVFDETVTLCRYRLGHDTAVRVGTTLLDRDVVDLIRASADDEAAAWRLFLSRPDQSYSFTDCVSFTMMRRMRMTKVAALDAGFKHEGFEMLP